MGKIQKEGAGKIQKEEVGKIHKKGVGKIQKEGVGEIPNEGEGSGMGKGMWGKHKGMGGAGMGAVGRGSKRKHSATPSPPPTHDTLEDPCKKVVPRSPGVCIKAKMQFQTTHRAEGMVE